MAQTTPKQLLTKYRAKRDFKRTQEPAGGKAKKHAGLIYMIQKHAATRLHYDFRLELDGVLKSWAVTRGPSLDPADKRLAVHVEDHPIEYSTFEGTIPKGEYGGGTVMLWDRGTWEPIGDARKGLAKGHLEFQLSGERLTGKWHLIRMHGHRKGDAKRENWLLVKGDDAVAKPGKGNTAIETHVTSVVSGRSMEQLEKKGAMWHSNRKPKEKAVPVKKKAAPIPKGKKSKPLAFIPLQLATLVDKPPTGKEWIHEIKFDGYRLEANIENGTTTTLLTRNQLDWTHKFQPIADALANEIKHPAILDGEVVALDAKGEMSFSALQHALSEKDASNMHYYVFDLLHLDGHDTRSLPLMQRKELLKALIPPKHATLHLSEDFPQSGAQVLQHACSIALEGIISKRADAPYRAGRNEDWLKSKCLHEQEFVIGGYTKQAKHAASLGALLVGYYEDGVLHYAGKVGTGFDQEESRALLKTFANATQLEMPFDAVPAPVRKQAIWLTPMYVAQVRFTEWTDDGRLRHPAFLGLREDKPAKQVTREREKALGKAKSTKNSPIKGKSNAASAKSQKAGITLTHPDKLLWPAEKVTKQMLADYYEAVAPFMLPHITGRPISLMRCPDGMKDGKACFFQRHAGEGSPEQLKQTVLHKGDEAYLSIDNLAGLMALVQMSALEIHSWGATVKKPDTPDRIVFDFDPHENVPFSAVKDAARQMRKLLEQLKLQSFLKTTGGKGLHVVVPITPGPDWDTVKNFAKALSGVLAEAHPERFTLNVRKAERVGRIYLDYLRNDFSASAVAPYSTRARIGTPVAWPISWEELGRLKSAHEITVLNAAKILAKRKADPWEDLITIKQKLPQLT